MMHPILIATAALVGLPVLIHLLLKQEPKRLLFPAVRFLVQKKRVSQRKLRLKHLLLLALRVLLIALFGLALFQPTALTEGLPIDLAGRQPVAAVFVLDTSPSMGYWQNDRTRLTEAVRRATEFLDELPADSKVAVLDPADPGGTWAPTLADARRKLDGLKEPKGASVPLTTALATAYQLLRTVDQEAEQPEPLPRLVAVFSDRAANCWDASRADDLAKLRDAVPPPKVAQLFLDVGVDQPANVGLAGIELSPQVVPQGVPVVLTATVAAAGPDAEVPVTVRVRSADLPEQTQTAKVAGGASVGVSFTLDGRKLPPGAHQVEVRVGTRDPLEADDVRYLTLKVAEPRKTLAIADDPADASLWKLVNDAMREFAVELRPSERAGDFAGFECVALLNVADPTPLWPKLLAYAEAGGKVLVMPGPNARVTAYQGDAVVGILPAFLKDVFDTDSLMPPLPTGVPWVVDDAAMRHPLLKPFREWKLRGNVDVVATPPRAWKYWRVDPNGGSVVVSYDTTRDAAVVERAVGTKGGRAVLLTTRMDPQRADDEWNTYTRREGSWLVVFPNLLLRYLVGDPTDANFNYQTGQAVPIPKPGGKKLRLEGPGVSGRDAEIDVPDGQAEVRLPPARTPVAGNFRVSTPDGKWGDGFSLNPPADEGNLTKVPAEAIDALLGPGSVVPLDRNVSLRDVLTIKLSHPIDLFPWLLILVLLLLAGEGVLANRFYRR